MTLTGVRSLGQRRPPSEIWRAVEFSPDFLPRCKVEVVVGDDLAKPVVEAIQRSAGPVGIDQGGLFQLEVGNVVRIRTGETDLDAI